MRRQDIRNLAIVAHVDHGKTTLVDALLRQSGVFPRQRTRGRARDGLLRARARARHHHHGQEHLDRVARRAHQYRRYARPFGLRRRGRAHALDGRRHPVAGRRLRRAAAADPLRAAARRSRPGSRRCSASTRSIAPTRAPPMCSTRFTTCSSTSAPNEDQLDFPILYTNARVGIALTRPDGTGEDLEPLFEAIISHLPGPEVDPEATLQFQANNLDYDEYVGRLAIGRVVAGSMQDGRDVLAVPARRHRAASCKVAHLYGWHGLKRIEVDLGRRGRHRDGGGPRGYRDRRDHRRPRKSAPTARYPDRRADRGDDLFGQQRAVGRPRGSVRDLAQAGRAHRAGDRAATSASASNLQRRFMARAGAWRTGSSR